MWLSLKTTTTLVVVTGGLPCPSVERDRDTTELYLRVWIGQHGGAVVSAVAPHHIVPPTIQRHAKKFGQLVTLNCPQMWMGAWMVVCPDMSCDKLVTYPWLTRCFTLWMDEWFVLGRAIIWHYSLSTFMKIVWYSMNTVMNAFYTKCQFLHNVALRRPYDNFQKPNIFILYI